MLGHVHWRAHDPPASQGQVWGHQGLGGLGGHTAGHSGSGRSRGSAGGHGGRL